MALIGLYMDSSTNREKLNTWEKDMLEEFAMKMTDKKHPFPCIPATIGYSLNHLRYGFIGDPTDEHTTIELANILKEYTLHSKEYGNYNSLIVFYHLTDELIYSTNVEGLEELFWEQLSKLTAIDEIDWVNDIPRDPEEPLWEFCFHGEKYFMYCATPLHQNRHSRNFKTLMLAITPRWVLQEFTKKESFAKTIKNQIRKRLTNYDSIPIHPDLNTYGENENFEWRQYFLRDDDTTISKCPYHRMLNIFKKP